MNAIPSVHICLLNDLIARAFAWISSVAPLSADQIKKLEDSRDGWQKLHTRHFADLLFVTELVAVGVVIEGIELACEIVKLLRRGAAKFKPIQLAESGKSEHSPGWIVTIGLVGWLCVCVGVAGEFWIDRWVNTDDNNIQSINITLLRDAHSSAFAAHALAQSAVDLSGTALSQSGKATLQVNAVRSETTSLQRDQAVLRENALASGSREILLEEHQKDNITSLTDFQGQEFEFGDVCNAPLIELDMDSRLARARLGLTLLGAKWIEEPVIPMGWSCNPGIWISVARNAPERTKLAASRLFALLKLELPEYRGAKDFTPIQQVQLILSPQDRFDTPSAPDVIRIRSGMHP